MRYTKKEVQGMFKRLLKAYDKQAHPILVNDNADGVDHLPGGWVLDYSSIYGGYVIEEIGEMGSVSHPFGAVRRTSAEMFLSMHMAAQVLENLKYEAQK